MSTAVPSPESAPWWLWGLAWRWIVAAWRSHPWRQGAALLAVALGVALGLSVHLINEAALDEFEAAARSANGQPDASLRCEPACDDALVDAVAALPDVASAHPLIELHTYARRHTGTGTHTETRRDTNTGTRVGVTVLGLDGLSIWTVAPDLGPRVAPEESRLAMLAADRVFLNPAAQQQLGANVGDELAIQDGTTWTLWRVAGQVAAAGPPTLVVDIAAAQARLGQAGRLTRVDVRLHPGATVAALHAAWQATGATRFPHAQWHKPQEEAQALSALSRAYRVNLTVLALVALFVGTFLVFSVLALSVAQRTPEFALLGVLGLTARERQGLVLLDAGVTGVLGAALGIGLGVALSAAALQGLSGDLGGGYFAGVAPTLHVDGVACAVFGGLGLAAALMGAYLPAQRVRQLAPAQALKGLGGVPSGGLPWWMAPSCLALGVLLALLPPWQGLPVAAYASVACLLLGGMAGVPPVVRLLVAAAQRGLHTRVQQRPQWVPLWLATWRASHDRQEATVAVAGVVASLSLAVALTVMVTSFRDSVSVWLDQVLPADVYARTATRSIASDGAYLPEALVQAAAALPGVARLEATRLRTLRLSPERPPVTLIARPLSDPAQRLPLVSRSTAPLPAGVIGVWVSEAVVALYGAGVGQRLRLPLGAQGHTEVMVLGVWRDYARQFGAIAIDRSDYQALTGDTRTNDIALWLHPYASADEVMAGLRRLGQAGEASASSNVLEFALPGQIRAQSLRIFDRSFAVTHYLQALAMGIGLFGIAASFSAQVLARRREFGLLAHVGLTRREVVWMVGGEGLVWTLAGAIWGMALGLAVAMVLVFVVNPQSFHWRMSLSLPPERLALLMAVVVLAGTLTAIWSARRAAAMSAVRAVKDDV